MRIAVMQPYLFPYLGYFQLLHSVDTFVLLDDVAFIPKGWINRNQLLVGQKAHLFTIPLAGGSQNRLIKDIVLQPDDRAQRKLLTTIRQEYQAAPEFKWVFPLVEQVLLSSEKEITLLVLSSLLQVNAYVKLPVPIVRSSELTKDAQATGQARIIAICQSLGAHEYVNMVGGAALYAAAEFARHEIKLRFLQPTLTPYPQKKGPFVPGMSVIDLLMYNEVAKVRELFQQAVLL
jgi:hypothetical protein